MRRICVHNLPPNTHHPDNLNPLGPCAWCCPICSPKKESPMTATPTTTTTTPATTTRKPKMDWKEAKARREAARATVGYDKSSPIYGMTTLEVCLLIKAALADTATSDADKLKNVSDLITELQKREAAQKLAFA